MTKLSILSFTLISMSLILAACSSATTNTESPDESNTEGKPAAQDLGQANTEDNPVTQTAPRPTVDVADYNIITLLPRDAIPSIDDPVFYSVAQADEEYADEEQVIGVTFNGEARAYSTGLLSRHEIVNDTVGGREIAVTW